MSPTIPPGGGRGAPDGERDDWQRRQRAAARGPHRAEPAGEPRRGEPAVRGPLTEPAGRGDPEPYGWGAAPGGHGYDASGYPAGTGYPAAPGATQYPGQDRGGHPGMPPQRPEFGGPQAQRSGLGVPGPGQQAWDDQARPHGDEGDPASARQGAGRRLRGPHRRRAVEGQETGLTQRMRSDLPSWLQERGEGTAPVSRLLSLAVAGFAALLGLALVLGAYTTPGSYALVVFAVQVLFVVSWTATMRPPGPRVVALVALVISAAADAAAALPRHASLAPLGLVTAAAVGAGVVGQLLRRGPRPDPDTQSRPGSEGSARSGATESLGGTLIVVVGVVCFAMLVVLSRHAPGTPAIVACLTAAGVALVVARLTDAVLPSPRTSPQVPRGSIGVVLGAMVGTVAAAVMGEQLAGLSPRGTALVGFVTALVAVLIDLAVSYAEVSRVLEGQPQARWVARHLQGPLGGFALASPVAYVLSVMFLVTNLN